MTEYDGSLNGLKMNAVITAENGVIGVETIFAFRESGGIISGEYSGGQVTQGYLVGVRNELGFEFRYCQIDSNGNVDGGESNCSIELSSEGFVRIVENFEWASRAGAGKNVLQEIKSSE